MEVSFPHDDDAIIKVTAGHKFAGVFTKRCQHEVLFRKIHQVLFAHGIIDTSKNIIDLGAWIGDNSLPWAKNIDGTVYAIDPSADNCEFISELVKLNDLVNVVIIQKAISEGDRVLSTNGDINHCSFIYGNTDETASTKVESTSLDQLFSAKVIKDIDYIHLDVEGMEHLVIRGSQKLIESLRPVVTYEVHLELDKHIEDIRSYFVNHGYQVYMINEVLAGNRPDCRNFIAIPTERLTGDLSGRVYNLTMGNGFKPISSTVVSMYFDLSKRELGRKSRNYLQLSEHLLKLPINLFLLADPEVATIAWKKRKSYGLLDHTYIIPIHLEKLPYYRYREDIERYFAAGCVPHGLNRLTDTALYFIVGWSKFWAIQQAISLNPFDSGKFVWVDYGIFHLWPGKEKIKQDALISAINSEISDKISVTIINETSIQELNDMEVFYAHRRCKIVSGYFSGSKDIMQWFIDQFDIELQACMKLKRPNLEEAIMSVVYAKNKSNFKSHYGDYSDLLSTDCSKTGILLKAVRHCRHFKLWDSIIDIYHQTSKSYTVPTSDILYLFDESLIAAWYIGKRELSKNIAMQIIEILSQSPELKSTLNMDHFNRNLKFHDLSIPNDV